MKNQLTTPETNRHDVFKERMRQAGVHAINHLRTQPMAAQQTDVWVWQGPSGHTFITQTWKDGSYDVFYPTEEQDTYKCAIDAITYAGGTQ